MTGRRRRLWLTVTGALHDAPVSTEAPHPFIREPETACVVDHRIARDIERWWLSRGRPAGLTDEDLARLLLRVSRAAREADAGWELLETIDGYPPDVGRYYPFRVGPVRLLLQLARFRALNREVVLAQGVTLALRRNPDEFEPGG